MQNGDTEADEGLHPESTVSLPMSDEQISILAGKIAQAISVKDAPNMDPRSNSETQQPHVNKNKPHGSNFFFLTKIFLFGRLTINKYL